MRILMVLKSHCRVLVVFLLCQNIGGKAGIEWSIIEFILPGNPTISAMHVCCRMEGKK